MRKILCILTMLTALMISGSSNNDSVSYWGGGAGNPMAPAIPSPHQFYDVDVNCINTLSERYTFNLIIESNH